MSSPGGGGSGSGSGPGSSSGGGQGGTFSGRSLRSTTDQFAERGIPSETNLDIFRMLRLGALYKEKITASTNFFQVNRLPQNPPCRVRIYIAVDTGAGLLNLMRAHESTPTTYTTETLNGGLTLAANVAYELGVIADTHEELNYQYTVTATVLKAIVVELDAATG